MGYCFDPNYFSCAGGFTFHFSIILTIKSVKTRVSLSQPTCGSEMPDEKCYLPCFKFTHEQKQIEENKYFARKTIVF
jgi:hypothetical protein